MIAPHYPRRPVVRDRRRDARRNTMNAKVGVVLSGCGFLDGSEIHEAVLTLLALDELDVETVCMAPRGAQRQVVDHQTGQPVAGETRDMLRESARIARGRIVDLAGVTARDVDGVVLPGGYGAAKNLCDFADKGARAQVHPEVARLLREVHAAHKPIGAFCIAPGVVAATLGQQHPLLTIGDDEATARELVAAGARHQPCTVQECVVDRGQRIVSTPAYMFAARPREVAAGIRKACAALVAMIGAPAGTGR
jgi:enhancing lycopene biosynthesis protein 2